VPKVGTGKNARHFPYTPAGIAAAKAAAKKTGKKVQGLANGGAVPTTERKGSGGVMPVGPVKKATKGR